MKFFGSILELCVGDILKVGFWSSIVERRRSLLPSLDMWE